MEIWKALVARKNQRPNLVPSQVSKNKRTTDELKQEHKDANKLSDLKKRLKKHRHAKHFDESRDYLDEHLIGWRKTQEEISFEAAKDIVSLHNVNSKYPESVSKEELEKNPELLQERKHYALLGTWRMALKQNKKGNCSGKARDYLDKHFKGWRHDKFDDAKNIYIRYQENNNCLPISRKIDEQTPPELIQEHRDAVQLSRWRQALNGSKTHKCPDEIRDFLDTHMKGWRLEKKNRAKDIVQLYKANPSYPKFISKNKRTTDELKQEYRDAKTIGRWRHKCPDEVLSLIHI
jgi:hypothetical protein